MDSSFKSSPVISPGRRAWIRRRLLSWFSRNARLLPWRNTRDPYAIWISEVMLQQTQVATVVPYYHRFLRTFPTLADLAAAPEQEVLRSWEGLGYYRRARHLHQAARQVVEHYNGQIPSDPQTLSRLPGLGRYTVGAVLSQAFDQRLPILETNSRRVLCRFFGVRENPRLGAVEQRLWQTAAALLPVRKVGTFNQALMELGALVCTPRKPDCSKCPLARHCQARKENLQEEFPPPRPRAKTVPVAEVAIVVRRGGRVLLVQRPDRGRWAGLWEFPHGPWQGKETPQHAARRLLRSQTGLHATLENELGTLQHAIMRYRITLTCLEYRYRGGTFRSEFYLQGMWLEPGRLLEMPVSSPQRRLAAAAASRRRLE